MNETSFNNLINFICNTLPNLFINIVDSIFTPVSSIIGDTATNIITWIMNFTNLGPIGEFVEDWLLNPLLNVGLIGLFSLNTLIIIIVLKIVDLVIPI